MSTCGGALGENFDRVWEIKNEMLFSSCGQLVGTSERIADINDSSIFDFTSDELSIIWPNVANERPKMTKIGVNNANSSSATPF